MEILSVRKARTQLLRWLTVDEREIPQIVLRVLLAVLCAFIACGQTFDSLDLSVPLFSSSFFFSFRDKRELACHQGFHVPDCEYFIPGLGLSWLGLEESSSHRIDRTARRD